jgi:diguanylate cyclase (GGDEF)-like protein
LRDVVHRAHLGMALVAMALAGSLLLLAGLFALRVHIGSNLELTARSVAYTVEAALVFRDAEDAQQTLARMLAGEGVAQAQVRDAQGKVFAQWQRSGSGPRARMGATLARLVGSQQATAPILFGGVAVGQVELLGDGQGMLNFVLSGVAVLLLCTAVSGAVGMALSRRMLRDIVTPLQALARVARAVHHERAVGQRVPPARGDDFNALLDELERRQSLLEEKNAQLTHSALHDSLTGLPNRAHFEHFLQEALARAHAGGQPMALLFLDNDGFKQVNDTHGHGAGDVLLAEVARRVQAQLRPGDLAARLGGDEFAVVMAPAATGPQAEAMAARLGQAIAAPLRLASGVELHPAASIGVALFPQQGADMEALLRAADAAMYHVKGRRRRARAETPAPR